MDRAAWDPGLLKAGLDDATRALELADRPGRFALEAAISGVHTTAPSGEQTDWAQLVLLYDELLAQWPSPAVQVARLVAMGRRDLAAGADLSAVEGALEAFVLDGPSYAARDASLALADIEHRTGRTLEAAARYRELLDLIPEGPLREFCRRRT